MKTLLDEEPVVNHGPQIKTDGALRSLTPWDGLPSLAKAHFSYTPRHDRDTPMFVHHLGRWYDVYDTLPILVRFPGWRYPPYAIVVDQGSVMSHWHYRSADLVFRVIENRFAVVGEVSN